MRFFVATLLLSASLFAQMRLIEIKADSLNVRLQPSASSPKIAKVFRGERFYTSAPVGDEWLMIMVEDNEGVRFGYIASQFADTVDLSREPETK